MEINYKPVYHPAVVKNDIPLLPKNIKARIKKAIEQRICVDPLKFGDSLRRTLFQYRKLRVGDYRVIYQIKKQKIIIIKIGHRKNIYKKMR